MPLYGVLIGVEVDGRPQVGVCYMPRLDELVAAATGLGCRWNGRVARVGRGQAQRRGRLQHEHRDRDFSFDAFEKIMSRAKVTRGWGDCYGHILAATGRIEVMLDPRMNPWDAARSSRSTPRQAGITRAGKASRPSGGRTGWGRTPRRRAGQ